MSICQSCGVEVNKYGRKYCDACWEAIPKLSRGTPRRVDANHREIVDALRKEGCSVLDTSALGGGFPDILVAKNGEMFLLEIKTANGKLNALQEKWHVNWKGKVSVVRSVEEALRIVRLPFE